MNEKDLISLWNDKRSQIITAQMQPVLVLIAAFVLSTLGYFDKATDSAKYFALVVIAITGILTTINQYAAIREGEAICDELSKIAKSGALAKKIAGSKNFVSLTAAFIVVADIAVFVFAYMAIFGM
jgi:fumarate reductase subunit D